MLEETGLSFYFLWAKNINKKLSCEEIIKEQAAKIVFTEACQEVNKNITFFYL